MTPVEERIDHEEARKLAEFYRDGCSDRAILAQAVLKLLTEHSAREELPAYGPQGRWTELREKADAVDLYREALKDCAIAANNGLAQHEGRKRGAAEKLRYIFKRASDVLLPATESAQPEEEPNG